MDVAGYGGALFKTVLLIETNICFGMLVEKTKKSTSVKISDFLKAVEIKRERIKRPRNYAGTQDCRLSFYGYPCLKIGSVVEKNFCKNI